MRRSRLGLFAAALLLSACTPSHASSAASSTRSAPTTQATDPSPTATPSPTQAAAPSRGTTLLTLPNGTDTVLRNSAGQGFSVLTTTSTGSYGSENEQGTVTSYDVAGRQVGQVTGSAATFTPACGAADVTTPDRRLIVTALVASQPAQGIEPATYAETLYAFDATTAAQVWRADVVPMQPQQIACGYGSGGDLQGFSATHDGAWGAMFVHGGDLSIADAVDLRTGRLYPRTDLLGPLGDALLTGPSDNGTTGPFTLTTPPQWAGLGSFSTGSAPGLVPSHDLTDMVSGKFSEYSGRQGLSPDQKVLFTTQDTTTQTGYVRGSLITAYSLPSMASAWKLDTTGQGIGYSLVGAGSSVLVVQRQSDSGTTTDGLDATSGRTIWSLPKLDTVCGLSTSQMLVEANGQVAVIDLATGKQIAYSAETTGPGGMSCTSVLPGGIAVTDGAVVQALDP